ncbi:MAG: ATP-binding protein [Arthrobacter sp.]|uniref:ATP-binding protein n=1 Tax=Arthrobacter sp. TaxID=1667 RepID=UPI003498138E
MQLLAGIRQLNSIIGLREEAPAVSARTALILNQGPTATATVIVLALIAALHPHHAVTDPALWIGVAIIAAATAAAFVVPWDRLPWRAQLLLPVADVVGLSLLAVGGHHSLAGLSVLLALPFFWLAWSRVRPRTVRAASFLLPLGVVYLQRINEDAGDGADYLLRPLLMPVMVLAFTVSVSVMSSIVAGTERRLGDALREAEQRSLLLDGILDAANVGVVVVDQHGSDVLMNARQKEIHRKATPPRAADPREDQLLVFGADRGEPLESQDRPVRRAVQGEEFTGQLVWIGPPGDQGAYSVSARNMLDSAGEYRGSVVVFHEVTDLLEALSAKDDFLANVNHELRTPLTSIVGYLEMAQDDPQVTPSLARCVSVARRNAERLLGLVGDMLDAAVGKLDVTAEPVDFAEIVDACVRAQSVRAERSGLELTARVDGPLKMAGDARRLGQVVDNLISNALKYTKRGGTVTVTAGSEGGNAVLEVSDTGIGMSEDELERAFTRFFRTASVRNSAIAGAGLGLAIAKDLVEAHGGAIVARSTLGEGTTFRVTLGPTAVRQGSARAALGAPTGD